MTQIYPPPKTKFSWRCWFGFHLVTPLDMGCGAYKCHRCDGVILRSHCGR